MSGSDADAPPPPPPPPSQTPTQQTPHTVSTIKLPILKKGEYDIWAMKMEHYLAHTDYPIWEVIQRGNGPVSVSTDTNGLIKVLPPKTAEETLAREREEIKDHFAYGFTQRSSAKFHKMTDAKEMWEAIKSRFGGNDESKKMQKYILKQQFEGFPVFDLMLKALLHHPLAHRMWNSFQRTLAVLMICPQLDHEDLEQLDEFNLEEIDLKWAVVIRQGILLKNANPKGIKIVGGEILRTLEIRIKKMGEDLVNRRTGNGYSRKGTKRKPKANKTEHGMKRTKSEVIQVKKIQLEGLKLPNLNCPQLDHEDLEQLDEFDLEEMDLKWQVAMISMRMKIFYKKTGRKLQFDAKESVGFDKTKVERYSCHKTGHFARECRSNRNQDSRRRDAWNTRNKEKDNGRRSGKHEDSKALVTLNGEGSDTEVTSCSKECKESYAKLKKLYDEQREQLKDASIEIQAYTQALKKVEAQLVAHQQSQLWYEEKIRFMKIDLDDKTDVLTYHKKLLAEAEKEKEDLKAKMSTRDKAGLGYGDQLNKGVLSYENEVFQSVFVSRTSETENSLMNDRYAEGMHDVPPPMTVIYIPSEPDKEIDDSQFTYGPKQSKPSEFDARSSDFNSCESNCSEETHESMPEPVVNEPTVVSQPKVWNDAPIIEEYESDSEDEHVSLPSKEQETPSFANTIKHIKTPRQTVEQQNTCSKSPKPEKRIVVELNKQKGKGNVQRENKPVWNNVQRVNHKNQFVPTAVLTRTGKIPVSTARVSGTNNFSTARQNFNSQAVLTNATRKISTVKPFVNNARPKADFHKSVSPFRKSFNRTTSLI
ncbi:hypothetical protein Tco_0273437, partial [Tanacetum coccineum]